MALRPALRPTFRTSLLQPASRASPRTFRTTAPRPQDAAPPPPVKKPVGAFRGGMLGFFAGSTLAGLGVYYYVLDEYQISNQMLSEDIYALQAAVQRTEAYTRGLENKVVQMQSRQIEGKK